MDAATRTARTPKVARVFLEVQVMGLSLPPLPADQTHHEVQVRVLKWQRCPKAAGRRGVSAASVKSRPVRRRRRRRRRSAEAHRC